MFIATLTVPILIAPAICMDKDNVGKSEITGTLFVASGLITLLQSVLGCRYRNITKSEKICLKFPHHHCSHCLFNSGLEIFPETSDRLSKMKDPG